MALTARDGGCSFPGCTHPPQWCDRHHILDWILGGPTDLKISPCSADTTTPTSSKKAGPAASTPTAYPNGPHPAGSTKINDPHINTRIRRLNAQRQLHRRNRQRDGKICRGINNSESELLAGYLDAGRTSAHNQDTQERPPAT